ncbi:MAG TPA: SIS domain-containing protein [Candidatus Sulfotelmatobacter sp.]|nr:SIS domain-containing protein [Candidatus Sulfotelmatobacter sp.]
MNPDLAVPDLPIIEGKYLADILDEPRALEATLDHLDTSQALADLAHRLAEGKFHRIVLTGMGSSFHALHPLNLQLISHGFTALMVETSELVHYKSRFFDPKTLIIAVSQSGQSAEMIRLAEVNRKRSAVLAVTNTPQSPLVKHSTAALLTHAGTEFSVSCKTYVTALMVLKFLSDILCQRDPKQSRRDLSNAPSAVSEYLSHWKEHVELLARKLHRIRHLFFVGRGASLAAVGTGALITKESDHFHAEGMSSAAFRHGPFEMLSEDTFIVVFSGDEKTRDLNRRLLDDIQQAGGHAEFIGENSSLAPFRLADHADSIRPILEILPVQMITIALAALANREAGKFERAAKITTTE